MKQSDIHSLLLLTLLQKTEGTTDNKTDINVLKKSLRKAQRDLKTAQRKIHRLKKQKEKLLQKTRKPKITKPIKKPDSSFFS